MSNIPYFPPRTRSSRPLPLKSPRGTYDVMVIYDNPEDQARYDRERAAHDEYLARLRREEDPTIRLNRDRMFELNRTYCNQLSQFDPLKRDFKTMVQSLTWLDQKPGSYVPPPRLSFYQVPNIPAPPNEPQGLPISFPRLGGTSLPPQPPRMPLHLANHFRIRAKMAENRDKYMALLSATECFCAGEWTANVMESVYDGVYPWGTNSPSTIAAADFAISSSRENGKQLRLKEVIRVNGQVLGNFATIYWITLEASNCKFYEAVVVVSMDQTERVLKYIRPAKYFPQIPAHLHHLLGPD